MVSGSTGGKIAGWEKEKRMSEQMGDTQQVAAGGGIGRVLWRNKTWWMLPLVVLLALIGIVYVLGHLGSADSEMYPTSSRNDASHFRLC